MSTELLKQALMGKLVGRIAGRGVRGAKQYNNNVKKLPIPGLLQNKLAEALGVESLDAFIKQSIAMRVVNNAAGRNVLKRVRPRSAKVDTPPVSPTPTTTTNLPSATPQAGGFNRAYGAVTNYAKANPGKMIGGTAVGTVGVAGIANRNPGFNTPAPSPHGAM